MPMHGLMVTGSFMPKRHNQKYQSNDGYRHLVRAEPKEVLEA